MDNTNTNNIPLVAVVGRPNVGKSTFVNRITGHDDAIVHEMRGVTRDRSYHIADWNGTTFKLIDTGGIEVSTDDDFQASIAGQALAATEESDVIVFVVDGNTGIQHDDEEVANILRRSHKPVMLVVNKCDHPNDEEKTWEFYNLGLGDPYAISAMHGHGTGDFLDDMLGNFPPQPESDATEDTIKIAIIGRPNAGKSSLTNCLTGQNRSIVSDVAGTTRDSIDTIVTRVPSQKSKNASQLGNSASSTNDDVNNDATSASVEQKYTIIDTAGLRKKSAIDADVEYFSFVRALRAIDRADVAVLVIDSTLGLTDQDQRVAGLAKDKGCALVIVLNKWDVAGDAEKRAKIREHLFDRMEFVGYANVVQAVAKTGRNLAHIWESIDDAYNNYCKHLPTSKLNNWLTQIRESGYTVTRGKQVLRMKYVTQTGTMPPRFTFFVNHSSIVNDNYDRFLENRLRENFDLSGTPVAFRFKSKS